MEIPTSCAGVDPKVLDPVNTWENKSEFDKTLKALAAKFIKNFKKFEKQSGPEVVKAGPKI